MVCLDNFDDYYDVSVKKDNVRPFLEAPDFTLAYGDMLDVRLLDRCMEGVDYVFHQAAWAGVRASIADPAKAQEVNATGTLIVLEAARRAGVKKVIYASSSAVYGKALSPPISEGQATNPVSPYAVSKLCAEQYCEVYRKIYGLDTVSLRYFTVFGPRMRRDLAIPIFMRNALAGRDINVFGDSRKSRDFTYIDNVIDANMRAMARGHGVYNIGSGHGMTVGELARAIVEMTGSPSRIDHKEDAPGDVEHILADISKAGRELGYRPTVSTAEGLRKHIREEKRRHDSTVLQMARQATRDPYVR